MSFLTKIDTTDVDLAMDVANHNFEVEKQSLTTERGTLIPDHVAIVNKETQQYLGTVGSGWEPVQPKVIYELAQELINATDGHINGVINMFGGSVIGVSFTLAQRQYVAGDPTDLDFLMLTSFNGSHGIAGHALTNRLVCLNQCNTSNRVYSLKHTRFVRNRLEVVKNMLKYYNNEIKAFDDKMMKLVNKRMNTAEATEWFLSLHNDPKSPRSEKLLDTKLSTFLDCLNNGRGSEIIGVKGTSYGAFQALTEFINHYSIVKIHNDREANEVRFQSINFGAGNRLTQNGLNLLTLDSESMEFTESEFLIT
jgi:phage/plasmid-like protein (TIGR03299 family)